MTRARETLCLFERADQRNPHAAILQGDYLFRRPVEPELAESAAAMDRRYAVWGLRDLNLGFAGGKSGRDPIHRRLAALRPGSLLKANAGGGKIYLRDREGGVVAQLSAAAAGEWRQRLERIEALRVLAMVRRQREDDRPEYRERCQVDGWEVPVVEVVYTVLSPRPLG